MTIDIRARSIALMRSMALDRNDQVALTGQPTGVAGAETVPAFGNSVGREITSRFLPPLLVVASVITIWWLLYLIYPRLLPSPMSTVNEAIRLVSEGISSHMYQSCGACSSGR